MDFLFTSLTGLSVIILFVLALFQSYWAIGGTRFLSGAWGGQYTKLPPRLRVGSAFSDLMFLFAIVVVMLKVQANRPGNSTNLAGWGTLAFAVIFFLSAILNFASRSKWERYLNAPSSLLLAAMFLFISLNENLGDE